MEKTPELEFVDKLSEYLDDVTEEWMDVSEVTKPIEGKVELLPAGEGWVRMRILIGGKEFVANLDAYGKTGVEC